MTKLRMAIIAVAFVLLAGLAGWSWYSTLGGPRVTSEADPAAAAHIGGPFAMVDQDGKPVDQSILKGKWSAVFFGYTYCPDICPLTLQSLARTKAALGKDADKLQIVFVTVDPARDTPANLKAYLKSGGFPQGVIGLTGTPAQVEAIEKAYGVTAIKQGSGDAYSYSHSAIIYLMNPAGKFDSPLGEDLPADKSAKIIRDAMRGYAG